MTESHVTSPPIDPRAAQRASLRRAVLQLVFGVIALHAVALAAYHFGGIEQGAARTRTLFVGAWTAATAIAVAVLLRRVRLIRAAGRPTRPTRSTR